VTVVDGPQRRRFFVEGDVFDVTAPALSEDSHLAAGLLLNADVEQVASVVQDARLLVYFVGALDPAGPVARALLLVRIETYNRRYVIFQVDDVHLADRVEILYCVQQPGNFNCFCFYFNGVFVR
jgi:hypothetical protein